MFGSRNWRTKGGKNAITHRVSQIPRYATGCFSAQQTLIHI